MNNIRSLRKRFKESSSELAQAIGKSQPTISKWEKKSDLKYEEAALIARHYHVSVNVVLGREDISDEAQEYASIDVVDAVACCGSGVANFETSVIGKHIMTWPALRELTLSAPENIKIMKVIGESMRPTINPDDMVWVDISYQTPASDGLYLLCVGDDLMVKRVQINPFNNSVSITSDNPRYKAFVVDNYKEVRVLGKVIYHIQRVG